MKRRSRSPKFNQLLTLSFLQTNTNALANSVDPDETAQYEMSHQDLHCLPLS